MTRPEPLTVNLVVQMSGMHRMDSDENFGGDLAEAAESFCRYFVGNLQKLTEPRGGDLLVVVALDRGEEHAGHQYREGRYLTPGDDQ